MKTNPLLKRIPKKDVKKSWYGTFSETSLSRQSRLSKMIGCSTKNMGMKLRSNISFERSPLCQVGWERVIKLVDTSIYSAEGFDNTCETRIALCKWARMKILWNWKPQHL